MWQNHKEVQEKEASDEVVQSAPNKSVCEGKSDLIKGKGKVDDEEESSNQDDLDDIDEYLAFLSRRFSKLKFKRNPNMSISSFTLYKRWSAKQILC